MAWALFQSLPEYYLILFIEMYFSLTRAIYPMKPYHLLILVNRRSSIEICAFNGN